MGKKKSEEEVVATFKERHGSIAAELLGRWDRDPTVTLGVISKKTGASRQNVHQLLKRLGRKKHHRRIVRPWGRTRFIPEVESMLRYLFNRFDNNVEHLGGRQFKVNGKKVFIMRRNFFNNKSLNIATSGLYDRDDCDFKLVLHAGQVFIVPFVRDYLPIVEMPRYHNRYDLLA